MADAFDAYYVWLGIGPEEQPANHYRLLGIRLFEPNPEVIESAADRQMAHLRTFQQGRNAALSQRLLNEVSAARVCLMNPSTRAAYDAQLRAVQRPMPAASGAANPRAIRPDLPVASPLGSTDQPATAQAAANWDALIGSDAGPTAKRVSTRRLTGTAAARKSSNQLVYIISAATVVLAAGVGLVIFINGMEGEPPPHDAQAAKLVEPQTLKPDRTSAVANGQAPAQPVAAPRDVMVTIEWPVADREDGHLTIDGKDQPLDAIKLEFPLAPGRHVIQLTREGYEPIRQTLDIGSQPLPPLAPHWVPIAAVAAAEGPKPSPVTPTPANDGDDAAATQPLKKLPVPSAAEQAQVAKQLDETYKTEHVVEKDRALAEQMLELADSPGNSPAERYMLFTKAVGLAAGASDFSLAFRGVDALDAAYEIDGFEMKQKLLDDAAKTITAADQITAAVAAAEQVIDQALADERYDTALELAATAKKLAESPRAEARFRKEATDRIARRVREIETLQKAAAVAIEAEATLEKSPDDPAANLTLGRWYCLYKRDWDRGLPYLAKSPDGPFKKLAQLELAVDLTLKPQLELADGWWDIGQKELGLPRDAARLHAGEIYRLQRPNLQPGLKRSAVEQRLKEVDSITELGSSRRRIDLLKLVHLKRDAIYGGWVARKGGLASGNQVFERLAFPYEPPEEYDFEVVFERISGNDLVGQICASGGHQFLWGMSGWGGGISAFDRVGDKDGDAGPTRREFGFAAGRHTSIVKVRRGGVEAWVDGRLIDEWKTDYSDMTVNPGLAIPNRNGLAILTFKSPTVFSSAAVTEISGTGKVTKSELNDPTERSTNEPRTASANRFPRNRWVDLLHFVDTTKHAVKGNWSRNGSDVSCEPGDWSRIEVPVVVDGSYDLEVEFTRTEGDTDVNTIFTVAGQQCEVLLSMDRGSFSGLDRVDAKRPRDDGNPTTVRPGTLVNGHRYKLLVNVRLPQPDRATVDVFLDGKPYLPHWEGNPTSLSLEEGWHLPDTRELGFATWKTGVTFHSMRMRLLAGKAINLAPKSAPSTPEPPVSQNAAAKAGGGTVNAIPHNRWIDALKLVDTQTDVVRGLWSRDGDEVSCQPEEFSRVKLPVILSGGYDLEVEFTRTGGKSDVCLELPVGPTACTVLLSATNGDYSGLEYVDGVDIRSPKNPVVIRPGSLENGRRYRLLARVRMFKDGSAGIDVALDGKQYLPHWEGKPSSLSVFSGWTLPTAGQPGLGAWKSAVTFHSARLRVVSGEAIPEAEYQKSSFGPKIIKARWGGGNYWADVSVQVRQAVNEGKTVVAKPGFLGADPTPGWRKHLEITFESDGQQQRVSIDEDRQWTPQEYAGGKLN
jgi:hypothetical protein